MNRLDEERIHESENFHRQDTEGAKEEEEGERGIERLEPGKHMDDLTREVIGSAIEVHRHLGPGFLEAVYEEALAIEFRLTKIPFDRQKLITVGYKGTIVGEGRLDFLVNGCLIVELKAIESFSPLHKSQVISYLKATRFHLGLLINFNVPILKHGLQRVILS